jgi:hypothetical protein
MDNNHSLLTSETIQMLVSSVTSSGNASLTELEAERLLNAIARVQSGVPTGVTNFSDRK